MADRLGITRSYLGEIESGRKQASSTLASMVELLAEREKLLAKVNTLGEDEAPYPARDVEDPAIVDRVISDCLKELGAGAVEAGVRINPEYGLSRDGEQQELAEILKHLRPWLLACLSDPTLIPYVRKTLRKALPHDDIDRLKE